MSAASKSRRIKLVFGIVIPVLVLVTTIVMVSISFAWFSRETEASIQSINLSTQKAFVLEFGSTGEKTDNANYKGQKAIDSNQLLVSPATGKSDESYLIDAPYYFISAVQISTGGENVSLQLSLDNVSISKGDTILDTYNDNPAAAIRHAAEYIPLAFTWFFKEHTPSNPFTPTPNYTQDAGSEEKNMIPAFPKPAETWYTPYGTMVFDETTQGSDIVIKTINGQSGTFDNLPDSTQPIQNFSAEEGTYFDFYIVFAPERMFWGQFFTKSRTQNVTGCYEAYINSNFVDTEEGKSKVLQEIFGETNDGMYYSSQAKYQGSTFKFGAVLEVVTSSSSPQEP